MIKAVFWDFGGVILDSPFDAFNGYELARGLPADFIRTVNTRDPDTNAWAQFERRELTAAEFDVLFADESEVHGHRVAGADVIAMLSGAVRPEMVTALDGVIAAGYITACLTNNVESDARPEVAEVLARFDHVIESSKVGLRKPEVAFYELACRTAGVEPADVVFLDERHLHVELGELRLAVGALRLVAEAAGNLEIAIQPGHHQELLQLLG